MSRDEVRALVEAILRECGEPHALVAWPLSVQQKMLARCETLLAARTPSIDQRAREEATEDERDRLYYLALSSAPVDPVPVAKWLWSEGAMLPADRQRGRDSKTGGA